MTTQQLRAKPEHLVSDFWGQEFSGQWPTSISVLIQNMLIHWNYIHSSMEFDYLCGFLRKYISLVRAECREDCKPKQWSWWPRKNNFLSVYDKQVNEGHPGRSIQSYLCGFWDSSHLMWILPCATDLFIVQHSPFALWITCSPVFSLSQVMRRGQTYTMLMKSSAVELCHHLFLALECELVSPHHLLYH